SMFQIYLNLLFFIGKKQGADQYILIRQNMAWIDAREYCRTHYTDLTSLRNDAEYQMVQEAAGGSEVWVGVFRDSWEWSDQTNSSFRYWKASHQVWTNIYNCGGLVKVVSGRWDELSCQNAYPFLCDRSE
uniref:C-type lectin domain-containing protein n=1 Tax=Amphilophus citrinellus TaxID=61819 RepID=A0A3Q0RS07_AMPCI